MELPTNIKDLSEGAESQERSLLLVLVDINPFSWAKKQSPPEITFTAFWNHLFFFLKAYLLKSSKNQIATIGYGTTQPRFLYPTEHTDTSARSFKNLSQIGEKISEQMKKEYEQDDETLMRQQDSCLSSALSLALCYINKIQREDSRTVVATQTTPRILVINNTGDASAQYIPFMNAIFSAQKKMICVDALVLSEISSPFLEQSCVLTNGVYVSIPKSREELLTAYLIDCFLEDHATRKNLKLPKMTKVDFRAACFCHKERIDIGYVCSVCLSIFCKEPILKCRTCGTRYPMPPLPVKPSADKKILISQVETKKSKVEQ